MPDEQNSQTGENQPQAGAPAPIAQPQALAQTAATQEVKVFDADYVKDLRRENADFRTKAKAAEDKTAGFESQIAKLSEQTRNANLRAAVAVEAGKLKIVDPDAAIALMDKSKIKFAEDGTIEGLEDALKALAEAKPYLVGNTQGATPPGNPARAGALFTREQLASMSAQEIVKLNLSDEDLSQILNS